MTDEGEQEVSDVAALEREFPLWDFEVRSVTVNSGPDAGVLVARRGLVRLTALTVNEMRRAIREAAG